MLQPVQQLQRAIKNAITGLTAATGAAGSDASYNSSTGVLTVPRGDTGATGPQGPAGADSTVAGPQGPAGADSTVAGPQGPQGPAGADGADASPYTHPNHSGEVTSTGDGATVIASDVVDADNLKVTGNGTTSQFLRSDGDGTFTWATPTDTNTTYSAATTSAEGLMSATDKTKLDGIAASSNNYSHPNHSGEVTSTGDGATVISDNVVDEANLKVSNSPTNGYVLTAQSGNTGGLTWEAASGGGDPDLYADSANGSAVTPTANAGGSYNSVAIGNGADIGSGRGDSIAIGTGALTNQSQALAIGRSATVNSSGTWGTAVGRNSVVNGQAAVSLGNSYGSGSYGFSAVIDNNSIYGASSSYAIAIGKNAYANGSYSVAIGGSAPIAGSFGAISLGYDTVSNGTYATVLGNRSTATNQSSVAIGTYAKSDIQGKLAYSSERFGLTGDSQAGLFVLRCDTTTGDPEKLQTTAGSQSVGSTNQVVLPNDSVFGFTGTVIARENSSQTDDFAVWEIKGGAVRGANAASTTLGSYNINKISESSGAANWSIALSADTTNGAVAITVTGEASHSIRWVATVNTTEVTY